MARFIKRCAIIFGILILFGTVCHAQFTVTATTVNIAEGGTVNVLLVAVDNESFSINIPRGYRPQSHPESRTVNFASDSGASAISVRFSTNCARVLPKQEILVDQVLSNHTGATLAGISSAGTGIGPAVSYDLFQPAGKDLMLRVRDIYVAYSEGSVELTFSCNSADFDRQKIEFMQAVNSFRSLDKNATINP